MRKLLLLLITTQVAGSWARAQGPGDAILGAGGRGASPPVDRDNWIAVVGDSGVTGAASDPDLSANVFTLVSQFSVTGLRESLASFARVGSGTTNRVYYSTRELREAEERGNDLGLKFQAVGAAAADAFDNAVGPKVARALGIGIENVLLVGQDGKRVSSIPTQLERIFEVGVETLPPTVLVSYTANDFCDEGVFTDTVEERAETFRRSLGDAWDQSRLFLKPHPRGTEFVVLAPLDVGNVLTNPEILDQSVPLGIFGRVTCRDLREANFDERDVVAKAIAEKFVRMCPAVLGTRPGDVAKITRLREVQDAFDRVWREQIARLNRRYRGRGLSWRFVGGTRSLKFGRGAVAQECFHPSALGHDQIAAEVVRALANPPVTH